MILSAAPRISCEPGDKARIFNIQRYSLNDGRGIRSVVFFKGCPHRCPWCANPESICPKIQFVRRESKCLHCARCRRDAAECPSGAWEQIGRDVTLDELLNELLKDDIFFRTSGGGVTLSGGEVLMQAKFAARLLARLRQLGIHTAVETAGDCAFSRLYPVASLCDEVLFDLKIINAERSLRLLRINMPRVQDNFARLVAQNIRVIPRVPLIPGFTLNEDNFRQILDFIAPFALSDIHLLAFHRYGEAKYHLLGQRWTMATTRAAQEHEIQPFKILAEAAGLRVTIGG